MTVFKSVRKALIALAAAGLGVFGLGVSANAAASCACMCIEGVSYEVCTGVVTTQAISQECTETLQCPVDTSTDETDSDVSAPEGSDSSAIDCRMRNVYRPDRGRYEPHPVCMPAEAVAAHERMKARHAEIADRFEVRHGRAHRLAELGEGRARGRRHDDDDRRGRGRRDGDDD